MSSRVQFRGVFLALVLCGTSGIAQVRRGGPLPNRGPGARPERTLPPKKGPAGKDVDKMARRAAEVERFQRMSPEMRQRALDRLPPERRARIEQGMRQYENMDPQNRERLRNFQNMPQEQRDAVRQNFRRMQDLDPQRRNMVRREVQELRKVEPGEREARMQTPAFRKRFNENEQGLIRDTVANLPDPD